MAMQSEICSFIKFAAVDLYLQRMDFGVSEAKPQRTCSSDWSKSTFHRYSLVPF